MKNTKSIVIAALVAVVAVSGGVFALSNPFGGPQKVKAVNGVVSLPVAKVTDSAQMYRYASSGKTIAFFLVKGTDGKIHAAFDACDACYKERKGYVQEGPAMLCRNCGKKFQINRIGSANTGGCNPAHLDFTVANGSVLIRTTSLDAGGRYF